jgi:hypothetical protein
MFEMFKKKIEPVEKDTSSQWNDPRWLAIKSAVLARDFYQCRACQRTCVNLCAHPVSYPGRDSRKPWLKSSPHYAICLCMDCHKEFNKQNFAKYRELGVSTVHVSFLSGKADLNDFIQTKRKRLGFYLQDLLPPEVLTELEQARINEEQVMKKEALETHPLVGMPPASAPDSLTEGKVFIPEAPQSVLQKKDKKDRFKRRYIPQHSKKFRVSSHLLDETKTSFERMAKVIPLASIIRSMANIARLLEMEIVGCTDEKDLDRVFYSHFRG